MKKNLTRRSFIKGAGLVIAAASTPAGVEMLNASMGWAAGTTFKPHAFIEIAGDDSVTIWVGQTELGQGTHTGLAMILADEMEADWQKVQVKQALAGEPFKDPIYKMQITGGSTSIRHRWDLLRTVAAAAREMLIMAAAQKWGVDAAQCKAQAGKVMHTDGRSMSYGQLTAEAAKLPVPEKPRMKDAKDYRIIGSSRQNSEKVCS